MHQQGGTIENALNSIASHEYVLPAIQREFVCRPEQVCNLFDSLMQGYPFGSSCSGESLPRTPTSNAGTTSSGNTTRGTIRTARNWPPSIEDR